MKLLFDFLPILLFFVTFKVAGNRPDEAAQWATTLLGALTSGGVIGPKEAPVLLATVVVILATLGQVLWLKARGQKVETMLWVSLGLVTVFGGATIWFHSETFIKWKPSVLYWVMGLAFWLAPLFTGRNLLRTLLGEQFELPAAVWQRLNFAWIAFFALMGLINLWVAYTFSTDVWVNFKLFGSTGLMLLFMLAQGLYLARHLKDPAAPAEADPQAPGDGR